MGNTDRGRVLVTGATGFVGRVLCRRLLDNGFAVRACVRRTPEPMSLTPLSGAIEVCHPGDIGTNADWDQALDGVDAVVHLAARVHVNQDQAADPLAEYMRINVSATTKLAKAAAGRTRRFVFVSSIKVNGQRTTGKSFDELDPANPTDPYGVSKWEAERMLRQIGADSGLEVAIVRPPLVYGPGVRANFLRLMDLVYRGLPLPLSYFPNRRSMIGVENLADLLVHCVSHPSAAHQTFLVSDGEDVSTHELFRRLAEAFGRPGRYLRFPEWCLRFAAAIAGKREEADRLLGSLAVNSTKVRETLNWKPPVSLGDGLSATARWYIGSRAQTN